MHQRMTIKMDEKTFVYISYTEIEKTFTSNLHAHPNIEILLFTDGKGYIQTTNKKIYVQKKDIVIINSNSKHCEMTNGLKFFAIGISDLSIFLKQTFVKKIIHLSLSDHEYHQYDFLYQLIYQEALLKKDFHQEIISNTITSILYLLKRKSDLLITEVVKKDDSDLIREIKNIIENYYYLEIKLDEIAHRLSQSKSTICHEFKKSTGMSIIEFKINKQLEEAANLLKISDMAVSQISILVGFNSTAYFTKRFKDKYQMTPKEYKKVGLF